MTTTAWAVCLATDIQGSCLIYESLGDVPDTVQRLRKAPLCRLLAAVAEFSNGVAVFTTIASIAVSIWRSQKYVVSILNSGADSVLPKMLTDRLELLSFEFDHSSSDYTVHSTVAVSADDVQTISTLCEFSKSVIRPLISTYLGRNLLDVFAIESIIQCELIGKGFPARLHRLEDIEPKKRSIVAQSNISLWNQIRGAITTAEDVVVMPASDAMTVVVSAQRGDSALILFTTAPIRKDQVGIRALTPDLQSALAEWTRVQTANPSEPGSAMAPRPPATSPPSERRSRSGPDQFSAPITRDSVNEVKDDFVAAAPGQIEK